jgi:hypothetical protein
VWHGLLVRALFLACLALAGCVGAPSVPEQFAPASRAASELQTRRYEVRPEKMLPVALAALQDLGFQVTSSDAALGLIVAQRGYRKTFGDYSYEVGQLTWQAMRNALTFQWHVRPEDAGKRYGPASLSAAVAIAPAGSGSEVRVIVHRFATRPTGEPIIVWAEEVAEPEVYAKFFDLLAQALARER